MNDAFISILRAHGFRITPQRLVILRILGEEREHLSPIKIYQSAQQKMPGITEATIYRTLAFLTDQGLVLPTHIGNGQLVYELAGHAHHHLVCRACGQTHEIDHATLQTLYDQFQASTGFQVDSVHLTFLGLCPGCQQKG